MHKGRYRAWVAGSTCDMEKSHKLRTLCFGLSYPLDTDRFDAICTHMLIEDVETGDLVCCFRILVMETCCDVSRSYSGQFYDLSGLEKFTGPVLEMGRFCVDPERKDPDILRLAWAALTECVDRSGARMLFGCASFQGTDPTLYKDSFALLRARYLAPVRWAPGIKAREVFRFSVPPYDKPAQGKALGQTPPLMRGYLAMGAWVSDHAVIDRALNTLHVFTGLEIDAIPPQRKKLLRAL